MIATSRLLLVICLSLGMIRASKAQDAALPPLKEWVIISEDAAIQAPQLSAKYSFRLPLYDVEKHTHGGMIVVTKRSTHVDNQVAGLKFEPISDVPPFFGRPTAALKLNNGWICAVRNWEFDGGVYLFGEDRKMVKKLKDCSGVDLRTVGGRHYAAVQDEEGAAVFEIIEGGSGVQLREFFRDELDTVQALSETVDNKLVMLNFTDVVVLSDSADAKRLAAGNPLLGDLSTAQTMEWETKNRAYVGMYGVVVRLDFIAGKLAATAYLTHDSRYLDFYRRFTAGKD